MEQWIEYALVMLQDALEEKSSIEGKSLYLPNEKLRLSISFESLDEHEGRYISNMAIHGEHALFTDTFYEMASCMGNSIEEAIQGSLKSFLYSAMDGLRNCFKKKYIDEFTSTLQGKNHLWHLSDSGKTLYSSKKEKRVNQDYSLWNVINKEINKYLGSQKCYWIKAYIGVLNHKNISEVRINDTRIEELSNLLQKYASTLDIDSEFYSEKQFFFLTQDNSTYVPYPHTQYEIQRKTVETMKLLEKVIEKQSWEHYYEELEALCGNDMQLAVMLDCFPREMAAIYAYQNHIRFGNEIFMFRNGKVEEIYYTTQFTAYGWIYKALIGCFRNQEVNRDVFSLLVNNSAIYKLIEQSKEKEKGIQFVRGFGIVDDDHSFVVE